MIKYTRNYHAMMQVYNKTHEEVQQLAKQVLELNNIKHKLGAGVYYDVNQLSKDFQYAIVAGLDFILKLNNDKKFLEFCFMYLYDCLEDEDMYEVWHQYLDKKEELVAHFNYHHKLRTNRILPL